MKILSSMKEIGALYKSKIMISILMTSPQEWITTKTIIIVKIEPTKTTEITKKRHKL